jgi:hypothetical protein
VVGVVVGVQAARAESAAPANAAAAATSVHTDAVPRKRARKDADASRCDKDAARIIGVSASGPAGQ